MTTLIAWIAIDQHAPSALYLASDSRISWGSQRARWDAGRKLFMCRQYPDIFGYAGDVVFPSLVLGQVADAGDAGLLFTLQDNADRRHHKVVEAIRTSFGRRHNAPDADFWILHGSRDGSGKHAQFKMWCLSFEARKKSWSDSGLHVPPERSTLLAAIGTGAEALKTHSSQWESSSQGGTSRAIFSAFCDAIRSKKDPLSGGVPQLVGMYHTRMPQPFGVIHDSQRYLHGFPLPNEIEPSSIEWRDELFQRMDGRTLQVLAGAQRHARPE